MAAHGFAAYRSGMTKWGQKVDSPFTRKPAAIGWRDDPDRPGIQRYWTGADWDDSIAPRATPDPAWKGARVIALGILIALAVVFTIWRLSQPSELECSIQRLDVIQGQRFAVEDACR